MSYCYKVKYTHIAEYLVLSILDRLHTPYSKSIGASSDSATGMSVLLILK